MIAFAEFSRNQELAKKVKLYFAMGPVATVGYMTSPLFRFLSDDVPDTFFTVSFLVSAESYLYSLMHLSNKILVLEFGFLRCFAGFFL